MDIPRADLKEKKQRRRFLLAVSGVLALLGGMVILANLSGRSGCLARLIVPSRIE